MIVGRRAWVEQIMGMPVSIHLRGRGLHGPQAARVVAAAFDDLREVDRLLSTYRSDSQVSAINRGELTPAGYHPLVAEVVLRCEEARERTGGYFDAELADSRGTVRFDPSGLVKGWAVERAARRLRDLAGVGFCVNAGGDIVVGGDGQPWRVGVEDPMLPGRVVATVSVTEGAVATSGTAQRGAHIVVPQTAAPAVDLLAATVVGPSLTWADVYATAAMARGRGALRWLDAIPGYVGMVVTPAGGMLATPGWPEPGAEPAVLAAASRR